MPFINPLSRKRTRSLSRANSRTALKNKIPRLDHLFYDGTSSQQSIESLENGLAVKIKVKSQVTRGMSSIKSLLGFGGRKSEIQHMLVQHSGKIPPSPVESCSRIAISQANHSDSTTIVEPVKNIRLARLSTRSTGCLYKGEKVLGMAPIKPPTTCFCEGACSCQHSQLTKHIYEQSLRRSQSTPRLHYRLSRVFQGAFGNPTVVRRSEHSSRPSVQALNIQADLTLARGSHTDSTSTQYGGHKSTPPTSDSPTETPGSVRRHVGITLIDQDHGQMVRFERYQSTSISAATGDFGKPKLSILTVEATSAAKTFLELHFNNILNYRAPRSLRQITMESKLRSLQLPSCVQDRVRTAWLRNESDNLRQGRALKSRTYNLKPRKGISIGGFEVVRVLGKGSFGVVRLVKEKSTLHSGNHPTTDIPMKRKSSRAIIKASAKEILAPIASRRRDLNKLKKEVYAMKVIRKSDMIRNSQEGHIRAERDFLVAAEGSNWIIPLIVAFQDNRFLYLVMDYCIGGDFLGLLIRRNVLSEEVTRWYLAEMILCVEEAHKMRWIHRDVKPDNFLIGADGHLKISDFGLAFDGEWSHDQKFYNQHRQCLIEKLGISVEGDDQDQRERIQEETIRRVANALSNGDQTTSKSMSMKDEQDKTEEPVLDFRNRTQRRRLARSVVGTSQYMAPEVVRGDLYDGRCDWWSIAIIMYECLYGYTPFACEDRHNTKLKILKHKETLSFPNSDPTHGPSREALDLMARVLVEKEKRLCSRRYELNDFTKQVVCGRVARYPADKVHQNYAGYFVYADDAEDIKRHPFFKNVDWENLRSRKPPFIPKVKDWEDTKYFEEEEPVSDIEDSSSFEDSTDRNVAISTKMPAMEAPQPLLSHQPEGQHILHSTTVKMDSITPAPIDGLTPVPETILSADPAKIGDDEPNGRVSFKPHFANGTQWKVEQLGQDLKSPNYNQSVMKSKKREKKRPRDKILRDKSCRKPAMEIRKKVAFLGYSYRKIKTATEVIEDILEDEDLGLYRDEERD